ncbi:MAG: PorV/PorQ family protein, partial [Planctomycetota bacterium]
ADTRYNWAGIAFPFGDGASAIGLQIGTYGFSDQPIYSLAIPEGDGSTYSVSETFFGLSYAQNFSDRFSAGITGKVINSKLAKTSATGFAVDFGTSFHALIAERPIRASFVIANLGTALEHDGVGLDIAVNRPPPPLQQEVPQDPQPARYQSESFNLPVVFRVGLAYDFVNMAATRLTFMGQFEQPNNSNATGGAGLEWALTDIGQSGFTVMARGSYAYQPDNNLDGNPGSGAGFATDLASKDGLDGMAFGGGLLYNRGAFILGLDYGYRHLGVLGGTHVYSLTVNW